MNCDVAVLGAGAAGLLAATVAAEAGRRVILLEKNRKAGVKILMSGGTRCNLTHAAGKQDILEAFGSKGRFLHSALAALGPEELIDLVEAEGVATKVEATGKVFPLSNRALDVQQAFLARLRRSGAELALACPAEGIEANGSGFTIATPRGPIHVQKVLVTTGGKSYPGCGTTGDGYAWAQKLGHEIVAPRPALVPLKCSAAWLPDVQGVAHESTRVSVIDLKTPKRPLDQRVGAVLFAHFGLTGPAVMDVSGAAVAAANMTELRLVLDFVPDLQLRQVEAEFSSQDRGVGKMAAATVVSRYVAKRLAAVLLQRAGVAPDRTLAELTRGERIGLLDCLKGFTTTIDGTLGFKKAEVTAGGVALEGVNPRTMESLFTPGLYFAGEVLDLDGRIGGYNFQAAFSTGYLAGLNM